MDSGKDGRRYTLSDADLSLFASMLVMYAQRDMADLTRKGMSASLLSELISYQERFEVYPSDTNVGGRITEAGTKRDTLREELLTEIQNVQNRAIQEFGADSAVVIRMGADNLSQLKDSDFLFVGRNVHSVATEVQEALLGVGLTAEMLEDLKDRADAFEAAVKAQKKAQSERPEATRTRVVLGNALYDLCTAVCSIGKQAYRNKNYAKYADYVIYEGGTPGELPGIPANLRYANNQVDWDEVEGAGSYHLEMRLDKEAEFNEVYFGELTHFDFTLPNPPVQGVTAYLFRVRAQNSAGMGEYSTELIVNAQ